MTPKQSLKRIQKATEKAEDAVNLLRPLEAKDVRLDLAVDDLHAVIRNLKDRYAVWGEDA